MAAGRALAVVLLAAAGGCRLVFGSGDFETAKTGRRGAGGSTAACRACIKTACSTLFMVRRSD